MTVDARRTSDAAEVPFTLTASVLGVSVTPNPDVIDTAQVNVGVERSYSFQNRLGAFTGRAVGSNLSSAKSDRPTIANGAEQSYTVAVDEGSTLLRVKIGNTADAAADLDLFVYGPDGKLVGQMADGDSEEEVVVRPASGQTTIPAGNYRAVVAGYAVPAGSTAYDYLDVFANAKFGTVAVTDANAPRATGATWTAPGVVTVKAAPAADRILLGAVNVVTDGDVLVGSGEVRVNNVTP